MESDGIDDAISNTLRTSLAVAGRLGEQIARLNESRLRQSEAVDAHTQRELQSRLDSERIAARAALAPIGRDGWWDQAKPEQIVEAWQTAAVWREHDPEIERAAERIRTEVSDRFGIDANSPGARPEAMTASLHAILEADQAAEEKRTQARRDELAAAELLIEADRMAADREHGLVDDVPRDIEREDQIRGQAAEHYQAAQLSTREAERYGEVGDAEAVRAKQVADAGQALPASEATNPRGGARSSRPRRPTSAPTQERSISR